MDIYDFAKKIESKTDFEEFLKMLTHDLKVSKGDWPNNTLNSFIEGLYGYNYNSKNDTNKLEPSWKVFAEMLLAARVYE